MQNDFAQPHLTRLCATALCVLLCGQTWSAPPNFRDHIFPILKQHCLNCHNADESEADLDLSTFGSLGTGSSGGPVVVAGSPGKSSLYLAVSHDEDYAAMPPESPKIPDQQLKLIHDWIAGGLLEKTGGKSQLRDVSFDVSAGSMRRPPQPAFPGRIANSPVPMTNSVPPIIALAASPWANVVAASGYRQVLLFGSSSGSAENWKRLGVLPFPEGDVHDLRFSANGSLLVVAGGIGARSGRVAVFDVNTGKRIATLADEFDIVLSADISADHQYVAIGTPKRMVKIFSIADGELLHRIKKHTDWVTVVRFSPDGKQLASADRNGGIHVWETETGGILYTLDEHKMRVNTLGWRSDGKYLASGAEDGKFVLWDMKDGWATRSIDAHSQKSKSRYSRRTGVLDLAFGNDGSILSSGRDRSAKLWKLDGKRVATADDLSSLPSSVAFVGDGSWVAIGGLDGSLSLRKTADLNEVGVLQRAKP